MAGNIGFEQNPSVTTTDATEAELSRVEVGENNTAFLDISIVARRRSDGASACFRKTGCVKRGTGNAEIVGSLINLEPNQKDLAAILGGWAFFVSVDGHDLVYSVKGANGSTIDWFWFGPTVGMVQGS